MASAPDHSLPKQCNDWGDLKAAYRFFHHAGVSPEQIQHTHRRQIHQIITGGRHPVVLAIEDTSELDFTTQTTAKGLGPIGKGTRQGLLQHSTLAVVPDGSVLGVLHQIWKPRVPKPEGETRTQMRLRPKESDLWPDSVRAVGSLGGRTRLVHVADRGGDTYDMMLTCRDHQVGFLIRSQKDRRINGKTDKLWSFVGRQSVGGCRDVPVPARDGRPARIARLAIRWGRVQLAPPQGDPRFSEPLAVWVMQAAEIDPPNGVEPIEWTLLTSEAMETFEQACERVDWYACRWIIEEWHKVEKTGCRLEASQLKDAAALSCLAAFVAVISVRILQVRNLAQTTLEQDSDDPSLPANQPAALTALVPLIWRIVVARKARCPVERLCPRLFWLTIAKRGGYLARKGDGPPGWQTIWKGWSDFMLMVVGVELYLQGNEPSTYG